MSERAACGEEGKHAYGSKHGRNCRSCIHRTDEFATVTEGYHLTDNNHAHDLNNATSILVETPSCLQTILDDIPASLRLRFLRSGFSILQINQLVRVQSDVPATARPAQNQGKLVATAQKRVPRSKNAMEIKSMSLDP